LDNVVAGLLTDGRLGDDGDHLVLAAHPGD
jgi:hypothetical protein